MFQTPATPQKGPSKLPVKKEKGFNRQEGRTVFAEPLLSLYCRVDLYRRVDKLISILVRIAPISGEVLQADVHVTYAAVF